MNPPVRKKGGEGALRSKVKETMRGPPSPRESAKKGGGAEGKGGGVGGVQ